MAEAVKEKEVQKPIEQEEEPRMSTPGVLIALHNAGYLIERYAETVTDPDLKEKCSIELRDLAAAEEYVGKIIAMGILLGLAEAVQEKGSAKTREGVNLPKPDLSQMN